MAVNQDENAENAESGLEGGDPRCSEQPTSDPLGKRRAAARRSSDSAKVAGSVRPFLAPERES